MSKDTFPKADSSKQWPYSWRQNYFEKGSYRYAYKGIVNHTDVYSYGERIVVKKWTGHHVMGKSFWYDHLALEKKTKELVAVWNAMDIINKKYDVVSSSHATCKRSDSSLDDEKHQDKIVVDECVLIEPYLEGEFIKWNSNSGWKQAVDASIHAFCHWTYHYTNGKYLYCDAQGNRLETKYVLTDPCILSKTDQFTTTDGGKGYAQGAWFYNHRCNDFCKEHWLKPSKKVINQGHMLFNTKKRTTYTWEFKTEAKQNKKLYPGSISVNLYS